MATNIPRRNDAALGDRGFARPRNPRPSLQDILGRMGPAPRMDRIKSGPRTRSHPFPGRGQSRRDVARQGRGPARTTAPGFVGPSPWANLPGGGQGGFGPRTTAPGFALGWRNRGGFDLGDGFSQLPGLPPFPGGNPFEWSDEVNERGQRFDPVTPPGYDPSRWQGWSPRFASFPGRPIFY